MERRPTVPSFFVEKARKQLHQTKKFAEDETKPFPIFLRFVLMQKTVLCTKNDSYRSPGVVLCLSLARHVLITVNPIKQSGKIVKSEGNTAFMSVKWTLNIQKSVCDLSQQSFL